MSPSRRKIASILATSLLAALFSSCASTVQSRIERNPELFDSLTAKQRELVRQGRIERGLPKGGVFLAWGHPDHVTRGQTDGKDFERWRYQGYDPVYVTSVGFQLGYGYGRYGHYGFPGYAYGTDVVYRPYTAAMVNFDSRDRVSSWEAVK